MPTLFVGIDVAQEQLDVCILPLDQTLRVANTAAGRRQLVDKLRSQPGNISQPLTLPAPTKPIASSSDKNRLIC
jgi:hypothetical protein